MPINPNIILGIKGPQIQTNDPLESYGKSLSLQALMGQGDLQRMQVDAARREADDDLALRSAHRQAGGDSKVLRSLLQQGGHHRALTALDKAELEAQSKRAQMRKDTAAADKDENETNIAKLTRGAAILGEVKDQPSYEAALRIGSISGIFPREFVANLPQQYDPQVVASLRNSGLTRAQQLEAQDRDRKHALEVANRPFSAGTEGPVANPPVQQFLLNKARSGAPSVNVNTEKGYGQHFAKNVADQDTGMLDAARKAPELANRANSIKRVLESGKVITGAGADYRLALGKALNLVGASDEETIANTETLSTNLARNTLDSIKASGLGSGSGFSNADRDFLEKAAGGKISLEAATIGRLTDLSHRAAVAAADSWNKRVKDIPESALAGTGISRSAIVVPGLNAKKPAALPIDQRTKELLDRYAPEGGQ